MSDSVGAAKASGCIKYVDLPSNAFDTMSSASAHNSFILAAVGDSFPLNKLKAKSLYHLRSLSSRCFLPSGLRSCLAL